MTKSITATLIWYLNEKGKYDINTPAPIAEWKNDGRKAITTSDLLHMNSG
jgi:CubicO group peptidase (beta-lactamase class C family)